MKTPKTVVTLTPVVRGKQHASELLLGVLQFNYLLMAVSQAQFVLSFSFPVTIGLTSSNEFRI